VVLVSTLFDPLSLPLPLLSPSPSLSLPRSFPVVGTRARTPVVLLFLAFRVKREITDGRPGDGGAAGGRRAEGGRRRRKRAEELTRITKTPKRRNELTERASYERRAGAARERSRGRRKGLFINDEPVTGGLAVFSVPGMRTRRRKRRRRRRRRLRRSGSRIAIRGRAEKQQREGSARAGRSSISLVSGIVSGSRRLRDLQAEPRPSSIPEAASGAITARVIADPRLTSRSRRTQDR